MPLTWASPHLFDELSRAPVQAAHEAKPGLHLALVRYRRDHLQPVDWVQNLADIDNQKVIWAHDMGGENEGTASVLQGPARLDGRTCQDHAPDIPRIQLFSLRSRASPR
jgi:hypothetical protein